MNKSTSPVPEKSRTLTVWVRPAAIGLLAIGLVLAMAGVLSLVWLPFVIPLFLVMMNFVISSVMLIAAAALLKVNPNITVALIGLGLACLSFACQPLGPEIGQYGTECKPIERCYGPLRGGGFPMQYMLDAPGITYQGALGIEDEFRVWPFVLDVIFYFALGWLACRLSRHDSMKRAKASAG